MAERRYAKGFGLDEEADYLTRTAWKMYFNIKDVPPMQWDELLKEKMKVVQHEAPKSH